MKRIYRELEDETKRKISNSMANRPKSDLHKQRISDALRKYWQTIPNKPQTYGPENKSTTPMSNGK